MPRYGTRFDLSTKALVDVATQRGAEVERLRLLLSDCDALKEENERLKKAYAELADLLSRARNDRDMLLARVLALDKLMRAAAFIDIVGQIDGHDVIRRDSVLDIIDARAACAEEPHA